MLSGATLSAAAIAGTAVFKIVVSRLSMKKATATSQGTSRALAALIREEPALPDSAGDASTGVMSEGELMRQMRSKKNAESYLNERRVKQEV